MIVKMSEIFFCQSSELKISLGWILITASSQRKLLVFLIVQPCKILEINLYIRWIKTSIQIAGIKEGKIIL